MLLNGYGDGQSGGVSAKGKECISTTISILQTIKCSEDAVDQMKSKVVLHFCSPYFTGVVLDNQVHWFNYYFSCQV